jgi:1-acyl-sn-glycerol-3-phosphate acyltransferase
MFSRFLRWIFNAAFVILSKREVYGLENLPAEGPYIVAANHLSRIDAPLLFSVMGSERVTGWAAAKYRRHPLFAPIVHLGHGIFIRRGEVDRAALQAAIEWLQKGNIFGLAPEGTRSKTGGLIRAKTGAAYLASGADVPLVPAAITGTEQMIDNVLRLRRTKLTVRFGKPFKLPPVDEDDRTAWLREQTDDLMCHIASLLPPSYRGVYADHPRMKSFQVDTNEVSDEQPTQS